MEQWSNLINDLQFDVGDNKSRSLSNNLKFFNYQDNLKDLVDNQLERVERLFKL